MQKGHLGTHFYGSGTIKISSKQLGCCWFQDSQESMWATLLYLQNKFNKEISLEGVGYDLLV